jgi:hypothetical protein
MKIHTLATLATAASLLAFSVASAQGGPPPKPRVACAADMQRLCPTAPPGKEAMRCMRSRMSEASPGCQSSIQAMRAMRAQQKAAAASQGAPPPPTSPQ